jgi:hypothetical protein
MPSETTSRQSGSSEQWIHIPHNLCVCFSHFYALCPQPLIIPQGEFAHRTVKRLFALTNKKDTATQIATKYRREARSSNARAARVERELELERSDVVAPELHHHISHSRNFSLQIRNFLHDNPEDPAKKVSPYNQSKGYNLTRSPLGFPPKTS